MHLRLTEVEELALGRFWAKVTGKVAVGTNRGLEHEVEGNGLGRELAAGRNAQIVFPDELAQCLAVVVVDLGQNLLVLLSNSIIKLHSLDLTLDLLLLALGVLGLLLDRGDLTRLFVTLETVLEDVFDKVVGSEDVTGLWVLAHPVGESIDVAAGLEDAVGSQDTAVDLEHVLLDWTVASR